MLNVVYSDVKYVLGEKRYDYNEREMLYYILHAYKVSGIHLKVFQCGIFLAEDWIKNKQ